eukprot:scaffold3914_cov121-Cylindrotheca_fusiformis.AAC.11
MHMTDSTRRELFIPFVEFPYTYVCRRNFYTKIHHEERKTKNDDDDDDLASTELIFANVFFWRTAIRTTTTKHGEQQRNIRNVEYNIITVARMILNLLLTTAILVGSSYALVLPPSSVSSSSSKIKALQASPSPADEETTPVSNEDETPSGPPPSETDPPPTSTGQRQQQPRSSPPQMLLSSNDMMRALGTSPRRIALGVLSASGIALAGNFLGVTSKILTTLPEETVEKSMLDTYFPRGDFKRCRGKGYTFVIPKEWVADTFVELAKAQQRIQPLDYSMTTTTNRRVPMQLPDSAYGPAGRLNKNGVSASGDTNVSVLVNTGLKGFTLKGTVGATPQDAAEQLLKRSIAPEGSGRTATLLDAFEDTNRNVYQFEYILTRASGVELRNIAVIAASRTGDAFYTLTVVAPAKDWENEVVATKLRKIANSFHLTGTASSPL